ncbi:hypothetical protein COCC4DRAFT_85702, partial [Bipolaris maydis ATCC 48331]
MNTHALRGTKSSYSDIPSQQPDSSRYSDSRSIHDWLEAVFVAHNRSEKGRADDALRATCHTAKSCSAARIQTKMIRDNKKPNARVTRSKSRQQSIRDEIVSVEVNVAAFHIAEGSEGEQNMEDIGNNCTAKHLPSELRMLRQPGLTSLPSTTSAHHWISADTQSQ